MSFLQFVRSFFYSYLLLSFSSKISKNSIKLIILYWLKFLCLLIDYYYYFISYFIQLRFRSVHISPPMHPFIYIFISYFVSSPCKHVLRSVHICVHICVHSVHSLIQSDKQASYNTLVHLCTRCWDRHAHAYMHTCVCVHVCVSENTFVVLPRVRCRSICRRH